MTRRFDDSEQMFKEALEIYRRLSSDNPQVYEPDVARTLGKLAILYSEIQRFEDSEQMFEEALEIRRRLSSDNPQVYEPDVATTLYNLAILYREIQRFEDSEQMFEEALEIYRRLSSDNPQVYEPDVAMTLYNWGLSYHRKDCYVDNYFRLTKILLVEDKEQNRKGSEVRYNEALKIFRKLAKQNPQIYELNVAQTLERLGDLYYSFYRYKKAQRMYQKASAIYSRLVETDETYKPDVERISKKGLRGY